MAMARLKKKAVETETPVEASKKEVKKGVPLPRQFGSEHEEMAKL